MFFFPQLSQLATFHRRFFADPFELSVLEEFEEERRIDRKKRRTPAESREQLTIRRCLQCLFFPIAAEDTPVLV